MCSVLCGARPETIRAGYDVRLISILLIISLFLKTVKDDSIRAEGNQGLPGLLRGRRVEDLAFAERRGPDPATTDNTANFAQTEVLARLRLGPTRYIYLALVLAPPPPGGGRSAAKRPGGVTAVLQARRRDCGTAHPTPDHLRCSDPPPSGEGEDNPRWIIRVRPPKLDTFAPRVLTQSGLEDPLQQ